MRRALLTRRCGSRRLHPPAASVATRAVWVAAHRGRGARQPNGRRSRRRGSRPVRAPDRRESLVRPRRPRRGPARARLQYQGFRLGKGKEDDVPVLRTEIRRWDPYTADYAAVTVDIAVALIEPGSGRTLWSATRCGWNVRTIDAHSRGEAFRLASAAIAEAVFEGWQPIAPQTRCEGGTAPRVPARPRRSTAPISRSSSIGDAAGIGLVPRAYARASRVRSALIPFGGWPPASLDAGGLRLG